jgi:hypothetical protein
MSDGDLTYPLAFAVGAPQLIFSDDFENGLANWTPTGAWGTTTSLSHSPSISLTDTPSGDYVDYSTTSAQLNGVWRATTLRFWHRYDTEATYDFARVQVSADGGPWTTVASYDGVMPTWAQETIDLGAYARQDLELRFLMSTDTSVTQDGWYIDDVELEGPAPVFGMAPPVAISPVGGTATGATPSLAVAGDAGAAVFGFRIYRDALCTDLAASIDDLAASGWTTPELPAGAYWWRAWAGDGVGRSPLSAPESFSVAYASAVDLGRTLNLRVLGGSAGGDGSRFELTLPAKADVVVDIHDARGARVRRLFSGHLPEGSRVLAWDGRDGQSRAAASGVYFVRAVVGGTPLTGRVVIVR